MKRLFVYCCLDSHLYVLKLSIESLKRVIPDAEIAIATYGHENLPPSNVLEKFASEHGYKFYDSPRQTYTNFEKAVRGKEYVSEVDTCEHIGCINVSHKFYTEYNYDMVYILHPDTFILGDFTNIFEKYKDTKYSFMAPYVAIDSTNGYIEAKQVTNYNGWQIAQTNMRITQSIVVFNKLFCEFLYAKYKTDENMWNQIFKNFIKYSDCSFIDLCPTFEDFTGILLEEKFVTQETWNLHDSTRSYVDYLLENSNLKLIHTGHGHMPKIQYDLYIYELYNKAMEIKDELNK